MKRTVAMALILMLLTAIPVCFGQDLRDGGGNVKGSPGSEKKVQPTEPQQTKPMVWPQPFQPSEEVGADSEVSFPTDI